MLARKLLRDVSRQPWQTLALALVFSFGIAAFLGTRGAYTGLLPETEALYRRLALPDLVATVSFAPDELVSRVESLPGVARAQGRIALETSSPEYPGVSIRALSLPAPSQPDLGRVEVVEGTYLTGAADEALVAEGAAAYHDLEPGDTMLLRSGRGEPVALRVTGIARQPEHLSMIPPQGFMATPRSFMVVMLPEETARTILGRSGGVTELAIELAPGADEEKTVSAVRGLLRRYRVTTSRADDLASVRNIRAHVEALGGAALVFPLLFLGAGALGGLIQLSRLVRQERGLIGLLRATGYGPGSIALHYLGYTLLLAALGAAIGAPLGTPIARGIRLIFSADLGIPPGGDFDQPELILPAVAATLLSGALAGLAPALAAARLAPALAMRPEAPTAGQFAAPLLLDPLNIRHVGLRMTVRNLLRRPLRTLLTALGVTLATLLALAPALFLYEMERVESRVADVRNYDLKVMPRIPQPASWLEELASYQGVGRVEAMLELPVQVSTGTSRIDTYVIGLTPRTDLVELPLPPPGQALVAQGLDVDEGRITIAGPLGELEIQVAGQVDYPLGRPILLRLEDAQRLLTPPELLTDTFRSLFGTALAGPEDPVTTALLTVAPGARSRVMTEIAERNDVMRVDDFLVEQLDLERIFGLSRAFIAVLEGFAVALAVALLYNTVAVNALDRRREHATLRLLGYRVPELAALFLVEVAAVALIGFLPGVPAALWIARLALTDFQEFLPGGISLYPQAITLAALGLGLVTLLASWPALWRLSRLDLAEVVRERE